MKRKNIRRIIIISAWIAVWFIAAKAIDNSLLLATPAQAAGELFSMLGDMAFYKTVGMSLLRIGGGFLAGFAAAVILASLSSCFGLLEEVLSPVMTLLKAIPVASFVVLLLIWWGSSFLAVAVCFAVVLPNIYINTLTGLKNTDRQLLQMAQVFRISKRDRFFYIYRPAIAPFLYSGMNLSLGMCWKSGVAAEVIGTPDNSIGEGLYLSKIYLNVSGVFAWTAVIICLSVLFEKLVLRLARCFFEWEPACGGSASRTRAGGQPQKGAAKERAGGQPPEEVPDGRFPGKSAGVPAGRLAVSHVDKAFGGVQVLSDVNAVYEAGRTYLLDSPSGSGKTTLLHILAGLLQPDRGEVEGAGRFSMVFQEDRLCMDYSAVKNVEMVVGDPALAESALKKLLGADALHKPCRELSGGMKRRVALVRAMEAESDFLLLDEPFTGMDGGTRARAERYIRERQAGRTIIMVTHI